MWPLGPSRRELNKVYALHPCHPRSLWRRKCLKKIKLACLHRDCRANGHYWHYLPGAITWIKSVQVVWRSVCVHLCVYLLYLLYWVLHLLCFVRKWRNKYDQINQSNVNIIYACPIFKWVPETRLHDKVQYQDTCPWNDYRPDTMPHQLMYPREKW